MEIYFFICLGIVLVNQELVHIYNLYNEILYKNVVTPAGSKQQQSEKFYNYDGFLLFDFANMNLSPFLCQ